MPESDQPVSPAPAPVSRPWLSWVLIWLFGAAVGAALAIWWLLPQVGKVSFTDVIQRHHAKVAAASPSPSATPVAKTQITANASTPAAGTCLAATGSNATVTLDQDIPSPRCVQLTSSQTWSYNNQTGQAVTVYDGDAAVTIPAGQTGSFDFKKFSFGAGVHDEKVFIGSTAFYGGSGPEIWVK